MNINSTNVGSETFLIAVPLQDFLQQTENSSLVLEQNLLLKALDDGSYVLNTSQVLNNVESVPLLTKQTQNLEQNDKNKENKCSTEDKSKENSVSPNNSITIVKKPKKGKPKVRYLNNKIISKTVQKSGRPKNRTIGKGPFTCGKCGLQFGKWSNFKNHEISHKNEKLYKCDICQTSFNISSNYVLHAATHKVNNLSCPECGTAFQRLASLKAHLRIHEKDETLYCHECDITFDNDVDLNNHFRDHIHDEKFSANSLKCQICDYEFIDQNKHKKHVAEHNKVKNMLHVRRKRYIHPRDNKKLHVCSHCKKTFPKLSQLERHSRVHSGEKPFVCSVCSRGFSQNSTLKSHMTKHNGLKPFKCSLCPSTFSQKGNLRAHVLKTHTPNPGVNVFACTECSCVFKKLGSLNGHITRNHPEIKTFEGIEALNNLIDTTNTEKEKDILQQAILRSEANVNIQEEKKTEELKSSIIAIADVDLEGKLHRYKIKQRIVGNVRWHLCTYCTKEFRKPSDLVRHLRVHTREKPFVCKICDRSFAVKSTLKTHHKTHTENEKKERTCKLCVKLFPSVTDYNDHVKKYHTSHVCRFCFKTFRTSRLLKQHSQVHMSKEEIQEVMCQEISLQEPIILTNKGIQTVNVSLKKRPLKEAGSINRPYRCNTCGACYRKFSHLKQHRLMHSDERPFKCRTCRNTFQSNKALKIHQVTHTGSKPYHCLTCSKNFTVLSSLKRHMESHSSTRSVICPYCFKNFKTVVTCRKHIKTHKGEKGYESQDADFSPKINELPYTADLEDALADDSFNLTPIETPITIKSNEVAPISHLNIIGNNAVFIQNQNITQENITQSTLPQNIIQNVPQQKINSASVTYNLEKQNIQLMQQNNILQTNLLDDTLNSQMLNIIGSENFIDTSMYTTIQNVIPTTDELVNTLTGNDKTIDENQLMFILPVPDQINGYENNVDVNNLILSQLKLQNDSLYLNVIPGCDQNGWIPFQVTSQLSQAGEMLVLPPEIDQTNQQLTESICLEQIDPNLQIKLTENMFLANNDTNLSQNENIQQTLNVEENTTNIIKNDTNQYSLSQVSALKTICDVCKISFSSEDEMKLHNCINFTPVEEIITKNDKIVKNEDVNIVLKVVPDKIKEQKSKNSEKKSSTAMDPQKHKYQCTFCSKSFKKSCDLNRHTRTHTGERPYKCHECHKMFTLKSTLDAHIKIHQGKKEFACPVCNALFSTKSSKKLHMRLHSGAKPFKCFFCSLTFRTSGHRKAHLFVHYKEATKTGKEPQDIITRKAKPKLNTIIDAAIEEINQNKELDSSSQYINEEMTIENAQILEEFNITSNPQISMDTNIILTDANILLDVNNEKEVKFDDLDEKTKQQIELWLKKNNITTEPIKNISLLCDICKKSFKSKYFLDRHYKGHTNEKEFVCDVCSRLFAQKGHLKVHMKTHSSLRPYHCSLCSNTFNTSGNLKTHMKRIHGKKLEVQNFATSNLFTPVFLDIYPS